MFRKQIFIFVLLCFGMTTAIFANGAKPEKASADNNGSRAGFYIGLQGGLAKTDDGSGYEDFVHAVALYYMQQTGNLAMEEINRGYFGARAFVGYNINNYLGLEIGAAFSPNNRYLVSGGDGSFDDDTKLETWIGDFVGVLTVPLGRAWEIFGKGGIAYVNARITGDNIRDNANAWRPTYGVGIKYILNPNIVFSLTGSQVLGKDKTEFNPETFTVTNYRSVIPTCNLLSFGIEYRFSNSTL